MGSVSPERCHVHAGAEPKEQLWAEAAEPQQQHSSRHQARRRACGRPEHWAQIKIPGPRGVPCQTAEMAAYCCAD